MRTSQLTLKLKPVDIVQETIIMNKKRQKLRSREGPRLQRSLK